MITCYENARVYTGGGAFSECFAVRDGRFLFTGSAKEAHRLYPEADFVELKGRFVCPGFNDSHMHLLGLGTALAQAQLAEHTESLAAMLEALRVFAVSNPDNSWVLGRGFNQDYFSDVSRFPDKNDLDGVCPDRPCVITRACGHVAVANSLALKAAGIADCAPATDGGKVYIGKDGKPNGVLAENAISLVTSLIPRPDRETIKNQLVLAMAYVNRFGITSVHSDDFSCADIPFEDVLGAYRELISEGRMTVRVNEQCMLPTQEALDRFLDAGYRTGQGDGFMRIGPLKLLTDGSLGARTAYLRAPYTDSPDTCGIPIYTPEALGALIEKAHAAGMQVAAHAIGDAAADLLLDAVDRAQQNYPRKNARHGIVHAQIFTPDHTKRLKALDMVAYIQPIFLDYDTQIVHSRIGERADAAYPAASLLSAGVSASGGSDCPVEQPDVLAGIQCAVTRKPFTREMKAQYLAHEALTVDQALDAFTRSGAYASFEENEKGRICEGYLADFTVLGEDPFSVAPSQIRRIPVIAVYLSGHEVYRA